MSSFQGVLKKKKKKKVKNPKGISVPQQQYNAGMAES